MSIIRVWLTGRERPLGVGHTIWHGTFRLGRRRGLNSAMAVDQQTRQNDDDEDENAE